MCLLYALILTSLLGITFSSTLDVGLYTNEFAVKVLGGDLVAKEVAHRHGFEFIDKIGALPDYYVFKQSSVPTRSKRSADLHIQSLNDDPEVIWHKQQISLVREKRDLKLETGKTLDDKSFNDPHWHFQWYMEDSSKHGMNVLPVWNRGISGKGVVVSVIDDGIEHTNDDLVRNYDKDASYDFNDNDDDPMPRYDPKNSNSHGTHCAGEIAMEANNSFCGTGVAFNAKIGGIRLLDGDVTDATEARAFGYKNNYIDILSCSWGPTDDGMTLDGPQELAYDVIEGALEKGRDGKGTIFVWASGNGGMNKDDCECDGYVSHIGTIAVGSIENKQIPEFSERCSSVMAATYSYSGELGFDSKIVTPDLHNGCTDGFDGTSASAPLAAGIIALALERNPDLTWRDIQHIVVWTSKPDVVRSQPGWIQNGAGLFVNRGVGFGLMDADAIVEMADPKTWKSVPKKNICIISSEEVGSSNIPITDYDISTVTIPVDGCVGEKSVKYVEHVELFLYITHSYRGAVNVNLTSNSGTETKLLSTRNWDYSEEGFYYWPFMSVQFWGEEATSSDNTGIWNITIWTDDIEDKIMENGVLNEWYLALHGTDKIAPHRLNSKPTKQKSTEQKQKTVEKKNSDLPLGNKEKRSSKRSTDFHDANEPVVIKRRLIPGGARRRDYLHSLHRQK